MHTYVHTYIHTQRDADEDGYASLWVDDILIKTFEDKNLEYELSLMGQQVGRHTAVVRLTELPLNEGFGG